MFCGSCGTPVQPADRFCGKCGAKVETAAAVGLPIANSVTTTRKPLTAKQKKVYGITGGVVVVLAAAYIVLRILNGPSSAAALQTDFATALSKQSEGKLKALVDPAEKDIRSATVLNAFLQNASSDVAQQYEDQVSQLVQEAKDIPSSVDTSGGSDPGLHLVKKSSWLGTHWYIHFPAVNVHSNGITGDKVDVSIGDLKFTGADSGDLIASLYEVKVTAANDFGSETETNQLNLMHETGTYSFDPSGMMKNALTLQFPDIQGLTATLNGKPIVANQGQAVIVPAPKTGTVQVKANIGGVDITGSSSLQQDANSMDLRQVLNSGVAQHALQIFYNCAVSTVQAANDKKWSELTGADPQGSYVQAFLLNLQNSSSPLVLQKVMVDPDSVQINGNQVSISGSEFFGSDPSSANELDVDLVFQQQPGGSDWWIESGSNSWNPASAAQNALTQTATGQ